MSEWIPDVFAGFNGNNIYNELEKVAIDAKPEEEGFICLDRRTSGICSNLRKGIDVFEPQEKKYRLARDESGGRKTLFTSFECGAHRNWTWCDRHGGSLGNQFGLYVYARAIAYAGGMHFVRSGKQCSQASQGLLAFMPRVAIYASSNSFPRKQRKEKNEGNESSLGIPDFYFNASERKIADFRNAITVACGGPQTYVHRNENWVPFVPRLRIELRAALMAWSRFNNFPPADEPFDDFTIHIRCGDVLRHGLEDYGILPFHSILALIPPQARTIGIVTQPFNETCSATKTCQCTCQAIIVKLANVLRAAKHFSQPHSVNLRVKDDELGAWARLVFSPLGTLCNPSTFCLWPTFANLHGSLVASKLFPAAADAEDAVEGFHVVKSPAAISYREMLGSKGGKGKNAHCGPSVKKRALVLLTRSGETNTVSLPRPERTTKGEEERRCRFPSFLSCPS